MRFGRQLALLAPVLGSPLLIADLHTPKRFYNMLRVFKRTSPMSIGTWILSAFSAFSGITALAPWRIARIAQVPAAAAGAGLGTYTAGLFSATSTPFWAAATRGLSVRFAASSVACGAAALALFARRPIRQDLDTVCLAALAVELAATISNEQTYKTTGVDKAHDGPDAVIERLGALGIGTLLPLGLLGLSLLTGSRSRTLSGVAGAAVLGGSLAMRIAMIGLGETSASRPDISLRFTSGQ
jgi:protein NrfD